FTNAEAEDIGEIFWIACSRSVANHFCCDDRNISEAASESFEQRCSGRRGQLLCDSCRIGWDSFEQFRSCRRGNGKRAVRALNESAADVHGRGIPGVDAE